MVVIIIHRCDSCGVETQEPEGWEKIADDNEEDLCPGCFGDYLAAAARPTGEAPCSGEG